MASTRTENDGISHFWLRTKSLPGTWRPAGTWAGTRKSSSSPARHSRLTKPEISSVASMAATIRNSRLLADARAAKPIARMASTKSSPPRMIRPWRILRLFRVEGTQHENDLDFDCRGQPARRTCNSTDTTLYHHRPRHVRRGRDE